MCNDRSHLCGALGSPKVEISRSGSSVCRSLPRGYFTNHVPALICYDVFPLAQTRGCFTMEMWNVFSGGNTF